MKTIKTPNPALVGMAIHSTILTWRIPWTEVPGGLYRPWGHKESDMTERLSAAQPSIVSSL